MQLNTKTYLHHPAFNIRYHDFNNHPHPKSQQERKKKRIKKHPDKKIGN